MSALTRALNARMGAGGPSIVIERISAHWLRPIEIRGLRVLGNQVRVRGGERWGERVRGG